MTQLAVRTPGACLESPSGRLLQTIPPLVGGPRHSMREDATGASVRLFAVIRLLGIDTGLSAFVPLPLSPGLPVRAHANWTATGDPARTTGTIAGDLDLAGLAPNEGALDHALRDVVVHGLAKDTPRGASPAWFLLCKASGAFDSVM